MTTSFGFYAQIDCELSSRFYGKIFTRNRLLFNIYRHGMSSFPASFATLYHADAGSSLSYKNNMHYTMQSVMVFVL